MQVVGAIKHDIMGKVHHPREHFPSIAPSITAVEPCAVFIWSDPGRHQISTPGVGVGQRQAVVLDILFSRVESEVVGGGAELSTIVIVGAMACDYCHKLNFVGVFRNREGVRFEVLVVGLVEEDPAEYVFDAA